MQNKIVVEISWVKFIIDQSDKTQMTGNIENYVS